LEDHNIIGENLNVIMHMEIQKTLAEKHFHWLKWKCFSKKMIGTGLLETNDLINSYSIRITYSPPFQPIVEIIDPIIPFNNDIHLYHNRNGKIHPLCLYFPSDHIKPIVINNEEVYLWPNHLLFVETINPWIIEW